MKNKSVPFFSPFLRKNKSVPFFLPFLLRLAASGIVPARWFREPLLPKHQRNARTGTLHIEIVSHCWNYSHFLAYQLASLVRFPVTRARITMTVFYSSEDAETTALLRHFESIDSPNISWNWRELPRQSLFRRAIGRNLAAQETSADWVWFTDCDLLFRENCLDSLVDALQGRQDALVYPRVERCTTLLASDDALLKPDMDTPESLDIDGSDFVEFRRTRATGPLQIAHGDLMRQTGYCDSLGYYQQPSEQWCKAYEDRAFRWLLGTQGTPVDVDGVYRIRHQDKGRYTGARWSSRLRGALRRRFQP